MSNGVKLRLVAGAALCLTVSACTAAGLLYGPDGRFEIGRLVGLFAVVSASWVLITAVMIYFFHAKLFALLTRDKKKLSDVTLDAHGNNLAAFGLTIIKALGEVPSEFRTFDDTKIHHDRIAKQNESLEVARQNGDAILRLTRDVAEALLAAKELSKITPAVDRMTEGLKQLNGLLEQQVKAQVESDKRIERMDERQSYHAEEISRLWDGIEHRKEQRDPPDNQYKRQTDRGGRR